jgi:hypothetical protein
LVTLLASATLSSACSTTQFVERPHSLESFADTVRGKGEVSVVVWRPAVEPIAGGVSPAPSRPSGTLALESVDRTGVTISVFSHGPDYRNSVTSATSSHTEVVSLDDVHGYVVTRRGLGALEGMGCGLLGGVVLGAATAVLIASVAPSPLQGYRFSVPDSGGEGLAEGLAVKLGVTGAIVGGLMGAVIGHTDTYTF